jgi:hypothetical protein
MFVFLNLVNNTVQLASSPEPSCEIRNEIVESSKVTFARISTNLTGNNYKNTISCLNKVTRIPVLIPSNVSGATFISARGSRDEYVIFLDTTLGCKLRYCRVISIKGNRIVNSTKTSAEKYLESYQSFTTKFNNQPIKAGYITLINKQRGFFIPSICPTFCTPAYIIWEQNGFQYEIAKEVLEGNENLKDLSAIVNSAIKNGENRLSNVRYITKVPILLPKIIISDETSWLKMTAPINSIGIQVSKNWYSLYFGGSRVCTSSSCSFASISGKLISASDEFRDLPNMKNFINQYNENLITYLNFSKKNSTKASDTRGGYVTLSRNIKGFFKPSYCLSICTNAELIWEDGKYVYRILVSRGGIQSKLVELANSAIDNHLP